MHANIPPHTHQQTIAALQNQLRAWERRSSPATTDFVSTGCEALDALFPQHGIRHGSLVEWIENGDASGAGTLALLVGRRLCQTDRPAILIDFKRQIYPPALSACGFDLSTLIVVRPASEREALWSCEESLRSKAVSLVWARIEHLTGIAFRRLQLAAEEAGTVGLFVRPAAALREPSWADVRLLVTPRPAVGEFPRFQIEAVYSRGPTMQSAAEIEIDAFRGTLHEARGKKPTHRLSLVS
jgi:protein ImuA